MEKQIKNTIKRGSLSFLVALFLFSCKHKEAHEYHNIMQKIEAESAHYKTPAISSAKYHETVEKVVVKEGEHEFFIPERKSQITSYKCSECHTASLKTLKHQQKGKKAAHWNVKLNHANEDTMNCATCHVSNDMDNLQSLTQKTIDFNYSYKQCSQCHQQEFKDWKGGGHGKQLAGWAPPRLSNSCVDCHNPHQPHFEKRWPVRFNTQKVKERQ